eukprot:TRINITY_DN27022_c0_g1_i1.p1 TRINITY_DN27022_c0_g1~~TRINITY_DN27022_c0_g1_i1.p1  ORF type:complete len:475 (+),score=130.75 TRINITY_DN27022_c0_g1_i1:93-1517(+)
MSLRRVCIARCRPPPRSDRAVWSKPTAPPTREQHARRKEEDRRFHAAAREKLLRNFAAALTSTHQRPSSGPLVSVQGGPPELTRSDAAAARFLSTKYLNDSVRKIEMTAAKGMLLAMDREIESMRTDGWMVGSKAQGVRLRFCANHGLSGSVREAAGLAGPAVEAESMLAAVCKTGSLGSLRRAWRDFRQSGAPHTAAARSAIARAAGRWGWPLVVLELLRAECVEADIGCYNLLIASCADLDEGMQVLKRVREETPPSERTFVALMGLARTVAEGDRVMEESAEHGTRSSLLRVRMLGLLRGEREFGRAEEVWRDLLEAGPPNAVMSASWLKVCAHACRTYGADSEECRIWCTKAEAVFRQSDAAGHTNEGARVWAAQMEVFAAAGRKQKAENLAALMQARKIIGDRLARRWLEAARAGYATDLRVRDSVPPSNADDGLQHKQHCVVKGLLREQVQVCPVCRGKRRSPDANDW